MKSLENFVINYYENLIKDENNDYQLLIDESIENKNLFINFLNNRNPDDNLYNEFYHNKEILENKKLESFKYKLILETLKSFNANKFAEAFQKKYDKIFDIVLIRTVDSSDDSLNRQTAFEIIYNIRNKDDEKSFNKHKYDIIDMCQFYRYFITSQYDNYNNSNLGLITFEPLDTKEVTKVIKTSFKGKFYHLTSIKNVESIKKFGLYISGPHAFSDSNDPVFYIRQTEIYKRANLSKLCDENTIRDNIRQSMTYRNFPDRTFVFYTYLDPREAGEYLIKQLQKKDGKYCVVELDLKKHNNPIFQDTMMEFDDEIFYGYSNIDIPKDMITNIYYL